MIKPAILYQYALTEKYSEIMYDNVYQFNRLEWCCFADNPAIKGYRNFINRCGGKEVGYLKATNVLMDQKLHDSVIFEIMKEDFKPIKKGMILNDY